MNPLNAFASILEVEPHTQVVHADHCASEGLAETAGSTSPRSPRFLSMRPPIDPPTNMDVHYHEPHTAAAVANEFIALARENGLKLTQMKLQKLVFYAHGWHLGLQKGPLIDEQVEAWPYGPVVPSLYSEFKLFGSKAIARFAQDVDEFGHVFVPRIRRSYDLDLIRRVWNEYGSFSAAQLSSLTHEPRAPWATAQERNEYKLKTFGIDNEVIKEFFEKAASKNRGKVEA